MDSISFPILLSSWGKALADASEQDKKKSREASRRWKESNPEHARDYYRSNKTKILVGNRAWKANNPTRVKELAKEWSAAHADQERIRLQKNYLSRLPHIRERQRQWYQDHKGQQRIYQREYARGQRERNPMFRVRQSLSARLRAGVNGLYKSDSVVKLIGCSVEELRSHLQKQFLPGMSWDNYGEWHIDHIRPCASYNLTDPEQQRACFNFKNLQPLWAKDNLSKGAKYAPEP